jgi:hypothetical protein
MDLPHINLAPLRLPCAQKTADFLNNDWPSRILLKASLTFLWMLQRFSDKTISSSLGERLRSANWRGAEYLFCAVAPAGVLGEHRDKA